MGSFTPPPTTALNPGDCLDRYELLCVLAQGGMGTVWLARMSGKLGFERLVALKTILPTYSTDRQFCAMFLDEARISAQIDHENVARILDIGEDRGLLYYAMELIDGESVRKLYRDIRAAGGTFPMGVALRIAADACAGLHATHELRGEDGHPLEVVHRDVSPQNLLVSVRGTTKLIDFGVAKANARRSEETAAGTLKGKIEYMAPEQARGEALDRRADVYSVGAVLYELLAGRPVRQTDEGRQLAALHELMTGVAFPPLPPSVPHVVRAIVDRALARDPQSRFSTADELRLAIEHAMLATGLTATTDDVGNVLAHYSRERTARRKDAIERALRSAAEGRLNAATIVAPLSSRNVTSDGGSASGPFPLPNASGTGPSMTIGAAYVTARPMPGSNAAKIFAAVMVLALVGVLGLVTGVLVTRRQVVAPLAGAASAGPNANAGANGNGTDGADDGVPPAADPATGPADPADPAAPPAAPSTGTAAEASPRNKDGGAPTTASKPGKPTGAKPGKPGKPGDGDEYGF